MTSKTHHLLFTDSAIEQIFLIQENDYTLEGMVFRVKIDGKGCEGFTYATGFSEAFPDDIIREYPIRLKNRVLFVHFDPFTAHYLKNGTIDFSLDMGSGEEGFVITNLDEKKYFGKFYKDLTTLPPTA